jgi:cytochrome b involved in lipid metabolism
MDANFRVLYHGQKYDIKNFLHDHPGGLKTLQKYGGKCITQAMEGFGHSTSAYHMMKDFKVEEFDVNLTGKVSGNGRIITKEESKRNEEEIALLEELEVNSVCF